MLFMTNLMYAKGIQGINYFYVCCDEVALRKAIYKRKLILNCGSRVLGSIIYGKARYAVRHSGIANHIFIHTVNREKKQEGSHGYKHSKPSPL